MFRLNTANYIIEAIRVDSDREEMISVLDRRTSRKYLQCIPKEYFSTFINTLCNEPAAQAHMYMGAPGHA